MKKPIVYYVLEAMVDLGSVYAWLALLDVSIQQKEEIAHYRRIFWSRGYFENGKDYMP